MVVPRLTENYGASTDPPEKETPVCTLKNFPFRIEHTLQWARDWFEGEFKQLPHAVNGYVRGGSEFLAVLAKQPNTRLDTLEQIVAALGEERPASVEDCVRWARLKFEALFVNTIRQLLHNYPADARTAEGEPFWSGAKRQPSPLVFSTEDPTCMAFVTAAASVRAGNYGLKIGPAHDAAFFQAAAVSGMRLRLLAACCFCFCCWSWLRRHRCILAPHSLHFPTPPTPSFPPSASAAGARGGASLRARQRRQDRRQRQGARGDEEEGGRGSRGSGSSR